MKALYSCILIFILFLSGCSSTNNNEKPNRVVYEPNQTASDKINNPINDVLYTEYHNQLMIDYNTIIFDIENDYIEKKNEYFYSFFSEKNPSLFSEYKKLNDNFEKTKKEFEENLKIAGYDEAIKKIDNEIKDNTNEDEILALMERKTQYEVLKKDLISSYNTKLNALYIDIVGISKKISDIYYDSFDEVMETLLALEEEQLGKKNKAKRDLFYKLACLEHAYENGLSLEMGE